MVMAKNMAIPTKQKKGIRNKVNIKAINRIYEACVN